MYRCVCAVFALWVCLWGVGAFAAESGESSAAAEAYASMSIEDFAQRLTESKGKVVLINFFASWCPPCREELAGFVRLRARYKEDEVLFLGLSLDEDQTALTEFLKDNPLNYPVFLAEHELAYVFKVSAIPHNVVYNKNGELVGNQPGLIHEQDMRRILDSLVRAK
jgi:Thiol-disulfide isomerase and thioredoxins